MTEFSQELRYYCRNQRCKMKLPAPVENEREQFCCRGCYEQFYRSRCRVCEGPIERKSEGVHFVCRKPRCKSLWRGRHGFGRYHPLKNAGGGPKKPVNAGVKRPVTHDLRSIKVIAGKLTPMQYHCALVGAEEVLKRLDTIHREPREKD